jgi:Mn-dependent DtxR family transcriptional regulator
MAQTKYLRKVYELTDKGDSSTTTSELARSMDVSDASVSEAIGKLEDRNLVCRAPYQGFTLSPMGKNEAEKLESKHEVLTRFFENIGVEDPDSEAERVEDSISDHAVEKLRDASI